MFASLGRSIAQIYTALTTSAITAPKFYPPAMSHSTPTNQQKDNLHLLPPDVVKHTFGFLDFQEQLKMRRINKVYKQTVKDFINEQSAVFVTVKLTKLPYSPPEILSTFNRIRLTLPSDESFWFPKKHIKSFCSQLANHIAKQDEFRADTPNDTSSSRKFTLSICGNPHTLDYLKFLPETINIQELSLGESNISITNENLKYIANKWSKLEYLKLDSTAITSLEFLGPLPELKVLVLYITKISDADLANMAIYFPKLEYLVLSSTTITSLKLLGHLSDLKVPGLYRTKIVIACSL